MGTPEKGIPRDLFKKAVCVGVIPSEKKLAFGVGGSLAGEPWSAVRGNRRLGRPFDVYCRGREFWISTGGAGY